MSENTHRFAVIGPFEVPKIPRERAVDCKLARKVVFDAAHAEARRRQWPDIKTAHGLYVFCLSTAPRVVYPYYVGQAGSQTLYKRSFQTTDKPSVYAEIMDEYRRAKALMYLLPLIVEDGEGTFVRFAKSGKGVRAIVNMAEEALIAMALQVNGDLWNVKHRRALDRFSIDGTRMSWGYETKAAKRFRMMLHQGWNSQRGDKKIKPADEVPEVPLEAAGLIGSELSPAE